MAQIPLGFCTGSQTIAGSQITQRAFGYDTLGRLVSEGTSTHLATELPNWQITGYRYDTGDNRVVVTRGNRTEYYGRNALDQIIWMNTGGPAAPQPGQAADYRVFVYDDLGQLIQREMGGGSSQTTSIQDIYDLKWDSDGRLREIAARGRTNGVTLSALYAADGDRVQKSDPVNGVKLDSFGLHQRYSNTTGETHTNLQTPGISTRTQRGATLKDRYFHTDHLGSTQHLTDGSGGGTAVTTPWRTSFDAFGRSLGSAGSDGADATEFQWGGQWGYQREPGALGFGLDYIYQRYYDPELGRFISPDPIGLAGGLNLYAYCDNDPINAVDPSGEYLVRIGNDVYDFTVEGVVKGLNTGARAALEAMSGGLIDAGSAKCEPGYQGASLLAGAGSTMLSVIGVGQGVMAVRAAGGVRAAAVAAWNAAKARPKQIAAAARGIRDSVRGMAARVKALTGPNCFVAGTPVAIPGGTKPIEKLKRGDLVLSRDPNTGRATTRRVLETARRTADSVLTLELSASKGGPVLQRLTGTPEHPFFIEGGGMRAMGELGIGTSIVTRAGPPLVVTSLKREGRPNGVQVYNLEVEADHTYFVGKANGGTWVHNACPPSILRNLRAPGEFSVSASSREEALAWARGAFPDAMELPEAVLGQPYPKAPPGVKDWFQVQPAEPWVGNLRAHVKYEIWSGGKKTSGGSWGHIWF